MAPSSLPVAELALNDLGTQSAEQHDADSRPRILIVCDDVTLSAELVRRLSSVAHVVTALPGDIVERAHDELTPLLEEFALYARHEAALAPLTVNEPEERHGAYGPPRRGRKGKVLRW